MGERRLIHAWLSLTHPNKTSHFGEFPAVTVDTLIWSWQLLSVTRHRHYDHKSLVFIVSLWSSISEKQTDKVNFVSQKLHLSLSLIIILRCPKLLTQTFLWNKIHLFLLAFRKDQKNVGQKDVQVCTGGHGQREIMGMTRTEREWYWSLLIHDKFYSALLTPWWTHCRYYLIYIRVHWSRWYKSRKVSIPVEET